MNRNLQTVTMIGVSDLLHELKEARKLQKEDLEWRKSHEGSDSGGSGNTGNEATKKDLQKLEADMAIKVSELKTKVDELKAQVIKIWGEQQAKYDALVVAFEALRQQAELNEVSAETETAFTDFKTLLQQFDDTIPDVPPVEPPVEPPVTPA